ncbi:hypothetical protein Ddye_027509 [Dipteronia dyeriana]|uniref:F-box protein n=1 Tax=Dipteronia dyeriana TaxID=168575 RepID=A0AAD9TP74_9ROSI|nr:hypothetical protein Ddye_027509 [Dipteronia dyeriana]
MILSDRFQYAKSLRLLLFPVLLISRNCPKEKLLNDEVIIALADCSWEILDISGSDISDSSLVIVAKMCESLRAVDVSRCDKITATGVSDLLQHCHLLETLRCGGSPWSDHTARRSLGILKPKLNDVEGDSWVELDTAEIGFGAQSLHWFVWDVDPQTWSVCGFTPKITSSSLVNSNELPIAERFRLANVERDTFGVKTSKECKATPAPCREGLDDGRYRCQGNSSGFKSYQISQHSEVEI